MRTVVLMTVTGPDQPGITALMTGELSQHAVNVLDIGQAVIHDTLSLGMLVEIPSHLDTQSIEAALLARAADKGLVVRFTPISEDSYEHWVAAQGKPRHIVTLLARKITAYQISRLTDVVARYHLNIDKITRLSGRIPLGALPEGSKACVEFSVRGHVEDAGPMRRDFMELASELDVDIAYQEDTVFRRHRRLVVFDMDSTLIEAEVIDELAKVHGVGEQVAAITERAMRGELDFKASFAERVALLAGLPESALAEVASRLRLTEGAERLIASVRRLGYRTAILSGGFTYFGKRLQQQLGIDYVHANELEIVDGKVTGRVVGTVVDGQRKAQLLQQIAREEGIVLEQVIAVGDGANDLPMLSIAGLGIAFRAKPLVKQSAKHAISTLGLDGILYLMGLSDRDTQ
ncbi:MAG: phosphoserine phosphatase SerB [Gammaproteobacteria bacterium]|nr:MAG: phosphoserine phosphatase SerB [Gammaproteobacteria bacterium]